MEDRSIVTIKNRQGLGNRTEISVSSKILLLVIIVLTTAVFTVSTFAVDGGTLSGDITAGGGDALISEGVPDNNSDSDSLESILDNIPDDLDNEDSFPDGDDAGLTNRSALRLFFAPQ